MEGARQGAALDKRGGVKGWLACSHPYPLAWICVSRGYVCVRMLCRGCIFPGEGLREREQGIGVRRGALVRVGNVHARRHASRQTVTETVL